jgi:hypothetical protein
MYKVWFCITPHHWLVDRENHRRWYLGNLGQIHNSEAKYRLLKNSSNFKRISVWYSYILHIFAGRCFAL